MIDTTRRYPRSIDEAFRSREHGDWVHMPRYDVCRSGHRVVLAISIVGLCAVVALLAVGAL